MSFKIEQLAQNAIDGIREEIRNLSQDELESLDQQRLLSESIEAQVPVYYGEVVEDLLAQDHDLGYESDNTLMSHFGDVFEFVKARIHEEIEIIVIGKIGEWLNDFDAGDIYIDPLDDQDHDAFVLASAGWGTDEDYGSFGESEVW